MTATPALLSKQLAHRILYIDCSCILCGRYSYTQISGFFAERCCQILFTDAWVTTDRIDACTDGQTITVTPVRLSAVGKRAFPVSGKWVSELSLTPHPTQYRSFRAKVWNDLPLHVASSPSLAVFRQRLETFLFFQFLPRHHHMTHVLLLPFITTVWPPVVLAISNII